MVVDALRPVADETGAGFDVTTFDTLTVTAGARPTPALSFADCAMPPISITKCRWPA